MTSWLFTEIAHTAIPPTRTTITTRAIRSPRDMTGMIIYLPAPDGGQGGGYGQQGTTDRISRQGSEHVGELREQDPRRSDRAPARVPGRPRARRDRLRVPHASPRKGIQCDLTRTQDNK